MDFVKTFNSSSETFFLFEGCHDAPILTPFLPSAQPATASSVLYCRRQQDPDAATNRKRCNTSKLNFMIHITMLFFLWFTFLSFLLLAVHSSIGLLCTTASERLPPFQPPFFVRFSVFLLLPLLFGHYSALPYCASFSIRTFGWSI